MKSYSGSKGPILTCALHENLLLTGGHDQAISIWNIQTNNFHHRFVAHDHIIEELDILNNDKDTYILSASWDKTIKVWRFSNFSLVKTLQGHTNRVRTVRALGKTIQSFMDQAVSGGDDYRLILWDVFGGIPLQSFYGHQHFIQTIFILKRPDGCFLVSQSTDSTVRFWNYENGEENVGLRISTPRLTACSLLSIDDRFLDVLSDLEPSPERLERVNSIFTFADEEGSIFFLDIEKRKVLFRKSVPNKAKIVSIHGVTGIEPSFFEPFRILDQRHEIFSILIYTEDGDCIVITIDPEDKGTPISCSTHFCLQDISATTTRFSGTDVLKSSKVRTSVPPSIHTAQSYRSFLLTSMGLSYLAVTGSEGGVSFLPIKFREKIAISELSRPKSAMESNDLVVKDSAEDSESIATYPKPVTNSLWTDANNFLGLSFTRVKFNSRKGAKRTPTRTVFPSVTDAALPNDDLSLHSPIFSPSKAKLPPLSKK
jgi:WD40 repeat protein